MHSWIGLREVSASRGRYPKCATFYFGFCGSLIEGRFGGIEPFTFTGGRCPFRRKVSCSGISTYTERPAGTVSLASILFTVTCVPFKRLGMEMLL